MLISVIDGLYKDFSDILTFLYKSGENRRGGRARDALWQRPSTAPRVGRAHPSPSPLGRTSAFGQFGDGGDLAGAALGAGFYRPPQSLALCQPLPRVARRRDARRSAAL